MDSTHPFTHWTIKQSEFKFEVIPNSLLAKPNFSFLISSEFNKHK